MASDHNGVTASQPANPEDSSARPLPKGVMLGRDGKPCRTCTSVAAWAQMTKAHKNASTAPSSESAIETTAVPTRLPADCPADVERLGNHTWTLLHTLTATYPERPTESDQQNALRFIDSFSRIYPCSVCADDFREWIGQKGNEPRLEGRDEFGRWMCRAHNVVNVKLGRRSFDCSRWWERWGEGPQGKCG